MLYKLGVNPERSAIGLKQKNERLRIWLTSFFIDLALTARNENVKNY